MSIRQLGVPSCIRKEWSSLTDIQMHVENVPEQHYTEEIEDSEGYDIKYHRSEPGYQKLLITLTFLNLSVKFTTSIPKEHRLYSTSFEPFVSYERHFDTVTELWERCKQNNTNIRNAMAAFIAYVWFKEYDKEKWEAPWNIGKRLTELGIANSTNSFYPSKW